MDLRPNLQLQAMIKAMAEVVLPAVDPDNELACEQAQLVLGMLHLLAVRLPWQFHYDVDELDRALKLSSAILEHGSGGPETRSALEALEESAARGRSVLAGAQASPEDLESAILELRRQTASLLQALGTDGEQGCRKTAGRAVVEASREQIERERAWFAPQGWDTETDAPKELETLLATHPQNSE
jgi:hypothetical protein